MSSEAKAAHALAAGADATIDYKREDVAERVHALTGGTGVDRVVDIDLSTTAPLLPGILAPGGLCAAYGSNGPAATLQFGPSIMRGIAVRWFIVYELDAAQRAPGGRHAGCLAARGAGAACGGRPGAAGRLRRGA